jgi:DNA-binding response OmpR family regulator
LSNVLLLTGAPEPPADILPSLSLLSHRVQAGPASAAALTAAPAADLVLVDARRDLVQARQLLRLLRTAGLELPVLIIVAEGGWAAVSADWGADDVLLHTAGPGEVDARVRIAIGRSSPAVSGEIRSGDLIIDENTYSARLRGRPLDLTFKEFELLKFLAQSPGRVFTRSQLLQEVWGYDYFGGTRTVDVHVRRLRAKLGAEHEALIGTIRNVGYRFVPVRDNPDRGAGAGRGGSLSPAARAGHGSGESAGDSRQTGPSASGNWPAGDPPGHDDPQPDDQRQARSDTGPAGGPGRGSGPGDRAAAGRREAWPAHADR